MITYYARDETNFDNNGLGVLDKNIINPVVTEELNGLFCLEFDYPTHAVHAQGLIHERLIRCPVPNMDDQLFRIAEREKGIGGIFHIVAYHVFYDLAQNLVEDTFIVNRNGSVAIRQILEHGQFLHPFTGDSNITEFASSRMVRMNIAEILLDEELDNGFRARWGGEIVRDNFHVAMRVVRGSDNGVSIRNKKNLVGYTANVDFNTVVTRIMPQGFDGLFLPEKYVDSPLLRNYLTPRIRVIHYDQVRADVGRFADVEGALPLSDAHDMLRVLAKQEYSINRIDIPNAIYQIEFAPLSQTEEYKNFEDLETISMGDTVQVIHDEDGLNISARMVSYKYNPLIKAYISITLGNYTPKFTDVARTVDRVKAGVDQAVRDSNFALQSANGKNTNFYGPDEPVNPRRGDIWFRTNGDRIEIWIFDTREGVTQWWPLSTDLTQEQMRKEIEEARKQVEEALERARRAEESGEDARLAGEEARKAGETARQAADEARQAGKDALVAGEEALQAGQVAKEVAKEALVAGQEALEATERAQIETREAKERANQAFDSAITAIHQSNIAFNQSSEAFNHSISSSVISYAISTNGTSAPLSGWQSMPPTTTAGQFLWTRTRITLHGGGTIDSYSVSRHGETGPAGATGSTGAKGETGPQGEAGANAPTITGVREQFYLSTSNTIQTGGSWSDTVPAWVSGRHYWTRVASTFSNNTTAFSTPVLANGLNSAIVTAQSAQTLAQTLNTTVSQHATSIALNATNITDVTDRVVTAEATLIVQAGQIASRATQSDLDTLTGRMVTAETRITQNANTILATVSQIGTPYLIRRWERGAFDISTGEEITGTGLRSIDYVAVNQGERYIAQHPNGNSLTARYLFYTSTGEFIQTNNTSSSVLVPANARRMRVSVTSTLAPHVFTGNIYPGNARHNFTEASTIYSALLMQKSNINLRVASDQIINQINISPEEILIAGNRIRITGQTTIDNGVITNAMIANLAVTTGKIADLAVTVAKIGNLAVTEGKIANLAVATGKIADLAVTTAKIANLAVDTGKIGDLAVSTAKIADLAVTTAKIALLAVTDAQIANLDAGKINTGFLAAARIAAGVITSDKLTIANGFIVNAMIADATIQNAKIATLDAAKITTGTLNAARIGADAITAVRIAANAVTAEKIASNAVIAAKIASNAIISRHITSDEIIARHIRAGAITAEKLATNAIRVGFNEIGNTIQISSTALTFRSGTDTRGTITGSGVEYNFDGVRAVCRLSHNAVEGQTQVRGLSMHSRHQGDYVSIGWQTTSSGLVNNSLMVDHNGRWSALNGPTRVGVHIVQRLCFTEFGTRQQTTNTNGRIGTMNVNGSNCLFIGSNNWQNGIAFRDGDFFIIARDRWYNITHIRN